MKKFLGIAILSFSLTNAVSFYPAKETLRRIFTNIMQCQPGIYFSLAEREIPMIAGNGELQKALRLNGSSVYKSVYYPSKMSLVGKSLSSEEITKACNLVAQSISPFMGGSMRDTKPDLYEFQPLHILAQYEHDMHYCVRFLWAIKSRISLCITQQEIPDDLKKLLFGDQCTYIVRSSFASIDDLETYCLQNIPGNFSVIAYDGGIDGIALASRLYSRGINAFLFSLGDFINVLEGKRTHYEINIEKLKLMLSRDVKILYTAALLPNNQLFEFRKNEYMTTTNALNSYWYMPHVVEAMRDSVDYLAHGAARTFNSRVNDANVKNKGVNEGRSILKAFEYYKFDDEAIVIKLTGRYHFKSDSFLRLIENTPGVDGYITLDPRAPFSAFTGCFALKSKYFKRMLYETDWNHLERNMISVEIIVLDFMKKIEIEDGANILYVDELDVKSFVGHTFHYEW